MNNINNKVSRIETLKVRLKNILESKHVEVSETDTLTDLINKLPKISSIILDNLSLSIISSNQSFIDFFDIIDKSKVKTIKGFGITTSNQTWGIPLLESFRFSSNISLEKLFTQLKKTKSFL